MQLHVLHFAGVINRYDFIDTIIRFADPARFRMSAATFSDQTNIEKPEYASDSFRHFVLGVRSKRDYARAVLSVAKLLRREHIDILHAHHYDEALIAAAAVRLAGRTTLIVGRHYHDEIYLLSKGVKRRLLLELEGFVNWTAETIVVPSSPIEGLLERQGVPGCKVRVIAYGFDFNAPRYCLPSASDVQAVRQQLGVNGEFLIGNFGRHHRLKGQVYLLEAFARFMREHPDTRLLMVGDGPEHRCLRASAARLGIERSVIFAGWRTDATRLMAAVDVLVQPTLHEALPQVMVEALTRAKPLIITNVAGPSDHVRHLETGCLIPPRDSGAIAEAIQWVWEHPSEALAMGQRGRAYALGYLGISEAIGQFQELYEEAAVRGRPRRRN